MDVMAAIANVSQIDMLTDLLLLYCLGDAGACVFVDCCSALRHKSVIEYW
jgi:hypothetical protein